jgi:hypothetical protein
MELKHLSGDTSNAASHQFQIRYLILRTVRNEHAGEIR